MALLLDAGALMAIVRGDRNVGAILRVAQQRGLLVRTSAAVVAQVWRSGQRQTNLARVLSGVEILPLDAPASRHIGEILGQTQSTDVVDGHLGLLAFSDDTILTSDPSDLRRILQARSVRATVVQV